MATTTIQRLLLAGTAVAVLAGFTACGGTDPNRSGTGTPSAGSPATRAPGTGTDAPAEAGGALASTAAADRDAAEEPPAAPAPAPNAPPFAGQVVFGYVTTVTITGGTAILLWDKAGITPWPASEKLFDRGLRSCEFGSREYGDHSVIANCNALLRRSPLRLTAGIYVEAPCAMATTHEPHPRRRSPIGGPIGGNQVRTEDLARLVAGSCGPGNGVWLTFDEQGQITHVDERWTS